MNNQPSFRIIQNFLFLFLTDFFLFDMSGSDSAEDGFEKTKDRDVICTILGHGLHRSTLFSFHTIPKPFKESLERFHGNPAAWWSGQVLSYLLRLQPKTVKTIQDFQQSLNFAHPIVG